MTKIVFISDTHGLHDNVRVPPCDILVHSGDLTNDAGRASLRDFCIWFERQTAKHKVLIAGNHDWAFEKWNDLSRGMVLEYAPSATYLQDSGCNLMGLTFWGSPWSPRFFDWAFNSDRGEAIRAHWNLIPDNTDVLVTHGPPWSILDKARNLEKGGIENAGCRDLYEAMMRVKPRVHCFGHIHAGYGYHKYIHDDGYWTHCINASICNDKYRPVNKPFILEVP